MRIHLASIADEQADLLISRYEWLHRLSSGRHELVDSAADADLVLFSQPTMLPSDPDLRRLRDSAAWRSSADRAYVLDFRDRPWCSFPGMVSSMPRSSFLHEWQRAGLYPWVGDPEMTESRYRPLRSDSPTLLASFVGAPTHPVRQRLAGLCGPDVVIEFVAQQHPHGRASESRDRFDELMSSSMFILCPRGHGTGTYRVQETLAAGRVPVILSDEWFPPAGVDWTTCAIVWPENKIPELVPHLRLAAAKFDEMSQAAADVYDSHLAADRAFDYVVDQITDLHESRAGAPFPRRGLRDRRYWRLRAGRSIATMRRT